MQLSSPEQRLPPPLVTFSLVLADDLLHYFVTGVLLRKFHRYVVTAATRYYHSFQPE